MQTLEYTVAYGIPGLVLAMLCGMALAQRLAARGAARWLSAVQWTVDMDTLNRAAVRRREETADMGYLLAEESLGFRSGTVFAPKPQTRRGYKRALARRSRRRGRGEILVQLRSAAEPPPVDSLPPDIDLYASLDIALPAVAEMSAVERLAVFAMLGGVSVAEPESAALPSPLTVADPDPQELAVELLMSHPAWLAGGLVRRTPDHQDAGATLLGVESDTYALSPLWRRGGTLFL